MDDTFKIGKIIGVHGIKGDIKIYPYTNNENLFNTLKYVLIDNEKHYIISARNHKNIVIIKFDNIDDRTAAEKYVNKYILISREQATPLKENEHYITDLIGCSVYENDILLGKLFDIIVTGSNDVYLVKSVTNELLIPALKSVVKKIDLNKKRIDVILPNGLIDYEII